MSYNDIKNLVGKNCIPTDYISDLQSIYNNEKHKHPLWAVSTAFIYGTIVGKRQDRARRKRTLQSIARR